MTATGQLVRDSIAGYRITKLVTDDVITEPLRDRVIQFAYRAEDSVPVGAETWTDLAMHDPDAPKLATLVTCRWCTGMYVAAAVVLARRVAPRQWDTLADVLVVAAASALIARIETD